MFELKMLPPKQYDQTNWDAATTECFLCGRKVKRSKADNEYTVIEPATITPNPNEGTLTIAFVPVVDWDESDCINWHPIGSVCAKKIPATYKAKRG